MRFDETLAGQVRNASLPVYMQTKAEIVQYYQQEQGEGHIKSWRQAIVHELADITGMAPKNLERRFDSGEKGGENRLARVPRTAREKAQYAELGRKLPPKDYKAPENGYEVTFTLDIKISAKCGNIRGPYTVYIEGEDAEEFAKDPSFEMVLAYYMGDGIEPDYDMPFEDVCGIVSLRVRTAGPVPALPGA